MKLGRAVIAMFSAAIVPAMATSTATVTEAVNDVTRGSSQAAITESARIGSKLEDGQYLKTGVKSRAELQLADFTVTRLGADTIFDYSAKTNEIDLQAGTILFSKPKGAGQITIRTAAVTAAILGTTGFFQARGKTFLFGLIEGHSRLTVNGITYQVGPGEILRFAGAAPPQTFAYNVPHFLETSPLIVDFNGRLPNQPYIDREVAEYDNLVARGFITPPTNKPLPEFEGAVPAIPAAAYDSAGAAHFVSNVEGEPATPAIIGPSGQVEVPARPQVPH